MTVKFDLRSLPANSDRNLQENSEFGQFIGERPFKDQVEFDSQNFPPENPSSFLTRVICLAKFSEFSAKFGLFLQANSARPITRVRNEFGNSQGGNFDYQI